MASVKDIYSYLDELAPFSTQEGFDNAGLLVGRNSVQVKNVLVALDITREVILEAVKMEAQLIVVHHPVIFDPIRSVTDGTVTGELVLRLAEAEIAAICAHTNLDAAQGGVNDLLARALGLEEVGMLCQSGLDEQGRSYGIGRTGLINDCAGQSVQAFAKTVKDALGATCVRYVDGGKPVARVAVGGGACGSMLHDAVQAGCDTFVTADVKYNVFLDARELGINLLDAGHFPTEDVVCQPLAELLSARFPELTVRKSAVHREVFSCV